MDVTYKGKSLAAANRAALEASLKWLNYHRVDVDKCHEV